MLKSIALALVFAVSAVALTSLPASAAPTSREFLQFQAKQDNNRYDHFYLNQLYGN